MLASVSVPLPLLVKEELSPPLSDPETVVFAIWFTVTLVFPKAILPAPLNAATVLLAAPELRSKIAPEETSAVIADPEDESPTVP